MSLITKTDNSLGAFFVRVFLGVVIFPHGAQKVLGWFGGGGFQGTMEGMTGMLPGFVVILVMLVEFIGAILLIIGLWGRLAAIAMFCLFIGIIAMVHFPYGFFMNWGGELPVGQEGFEYHLLVLGMSLGIISLGSGRWSVDRAMGSA